MDSGRRRGQPLVAMVSLVAGYTILRTAFWEPLIAPDLQSPAGLIGIPKVEVAETAIAPRSAHRTNAGRYDRAPGPLPTAVDLPSRMALAGRIYGRLATGNAEIRTNAEVQAVTSLPSRSASPSSEISRSEPNGFLAPAPVPFAGGDVGPVKRLSLDAWVFLREGTSGLLRAGPAFPTYGASQTGAVLRYSLSPQDPTRPELYARIAAALDGPPQQDVAAGFSVRPVGGLPVRLHAEARLSRDRQGTELRPALFATAGFAKEIAPIAVSARGYAQAGYVGGRAETAFVDGQMVADRTVLAQDGATLALGLGAWGGAQRGAARLDAGPSASVSFRLGKTPLRLAADYRFRVAGDAEPGSGLAVTLSTGF